MLTITQVLIIDLDVHQGNGNAKLFEHNKHVSTFNMHCTHNVFSELQISDVDVELAPGTDGVEYVLNVLMSIDLWVPILSYPILSSGALESQCRSSSIVSCNITIIKYNHHTNIHY